VGLKPTVGLVSRSGIIPISASQDTAGPMTRTVEDAAVLLGILAGTDPDDPATPGTRSGAANDYASALDPGGARGVRIGVARKFFGFNAAVDRLMEEALNALRSLGAYLLDPADLSTHGQLDEPEMTVLLYEFKHGIEAYLATRGAGTEVRTLRDLITFNERHSEREMPFFGQDLFIKADATTGLDARDYQEALHQCRRLARAMGIDALMDAHRLDAIVAPTGSPAWLTDLVNGDHFTGGSSTPAAVAGYPSISVPMGFVHGLPVNLSFFGRAWSEPMLLKIAYAFEQETHHREPPQFLPTLTT
jgi:amidase